jgi:hypothetical protein
MAVIGARARLLVDIWSMKLFVWMLGRNGELLDSHLRGVNYFRRLATTISAGQDQQRVSPTTWRHSVVVVGRLVAVKNVSAGAPIGA